MLDNLAVISGEVSAIQTVKGDIDRQGDISGTISLDIENIVPIYTGATEVTPGDSAQVLATRGFALQDDIVVDAIPSNYGKITWNGSVLTVS